MYCKLCQLFIGVWLTAIIGPLLVAIGRGKAVLPEGRGVTFIDNEEVDKVLPLAPSHFPEAFQGILWMDQTGAYGHSECPFTAPDLSLSFGNSTWDPTTRRISLDITGPSWVWFNSWLGQFGYCLLGNLGFKYVFELSQDENSIQVYPTFDWGDVLGTWTFPKELLSFSMERIQHPKGKCPPPAGSSKKDISKCAKWDRVSKGLLSPLFGDAGVIHYSVFQIVDGKGNRIQPYFDAYLNYAKSTCDVSSKWLRLVHADTNQEAWTCPSAMIGQYQSKPGCHKVLAEKHDTNKQKPGEEENKKEKPKAKPSQEKEEESKKEKSKAQPSQEKAESAKKKSSPQEDKGKKEIKKTKKNGASKSEL